MKKTLFVTFFAAVLSLVGFAACSPGTETETAGYYPNNASDGLDPDNASEASSRYLYP